MERRFLNNERAGVVLEQRADGKQTIAGYASVFYDGTPATEYVLWDDRYGRAVERVLPGAFDGALQRPDDVAGLFNHDPNLVLGRTTAGTVRLSVDARGLRYEIDPGETSIARDVTEHIRRRDVSGSSFAFEIGNGGERWTSVKDAQGRWNEVREILAATLWDVSPVVYPAYAGTSAGLRSALQVDEARESWKRHHARRAAMIRAARARQVAAEQLPV